MNLPPVKSPSPTPATQSIEEQGIDTSQPQMLSDANISMGRTQPVTFEDSDWSMVAQGTEDANFLTVREQLARRRERRQTALSPFLFSSQELASMDTMSIDGLVRLTVNRIERGIRDTSPSAPVAQAPSNHDFLLSAEETKAIISGEMEEAEENALINSVVAKAKQRVAEEDAQKAEQATKAEQTAAEHSYDIKSLASLEAQAAEAFANMAVQATQSATEAMLSEDEIDANLDDETRRSASPAPSESAAELEEYFSSSASMRRYSDSFNQKLAMFQTLEARSQSAPTSPAPRTSRRVAFGTEAVSLSPRQRALENLQAARARSVSPTRTSSREEELPRRGSVNALRQLFENKK